MLEVEDKERLLKEARRSCKLPTKGFPQDSQLISQSNFAGQKGLSQNIQSDEEQRPTTKIALPGKAVI